MEVAVGKVFDNVDCFIVINLPLFTFIFLRSLFGYVFAKL